MSELSGLVGLIGDVHAEDALLECVLDYFEAIRVSHVLCVGDIVDGRGDVNRCCRLLQQCSASVVRGNHDRWILAGTLRDLPMATRADALSERCSAMLAGLPATQSFESPLGPLLLGHGVGEDDMALLVPYDARKSDPSCRALQALRASKYGLYVGGHTHLPTVHRFPDLTVINAGTLRSDQHPVCSVLDLDEGRWRLFSVGRRVEQRSVVDLLGPPTESVRGLF